MEKNYAAQKVFHKGFFTYTKEILNGILHFLCSVSSLMDIELDSEPTYGDNDNTYRPKQKHIEIKKTLIFKVKKIKRKGIMQMFTINNARFCY